MPWLGSLGMVHEKRGENREAADCYRKVIAFLDQNPDYSDPGFKDAFATRVAKLHRRQRVPRECTERRGER